MLAFYVVAGLYVLEKAYSHYNGVGASRKGRHHRLHQPCGHGHTLD